MFINGHIRPPQIINIVLGVWFNDLMSKELTAFHILENCAELIYLIRGKPRYILNLFRFKVSVLFILPYCLSKMAPIPRWTLSELIQGEERRQ